MRVWLMILLVSRFTHLRPWFGMPLAQDDPTAQKQRRQHGRQPLAQDTDQPRRPAATLPTALGLPFQLGGRPRPASPRTLRQRRQRLRSAVVGLLLTPYQ